MTVIHTFGDSHSEYGWKDIHIPNLEIKIHTIGPKLMYSFGKNKLDVLDITNNEFEVNIGDHVCFCFGEIDCRCHIHRYHDNYIETINSIAEYYIIAIEENLRKIQVNPIIFNVVPQMDSKLFFSYREEFKQNGNDLDRQMYTKYMNQKLETLCKTKNFMFLNVYKQYCNSQGMLEPSLSTGVHIKNPCFIEKYLLDNIKIE